MDFSALVKSDFRRPGLRFLYREKLKIYFV